MSAERILTDEMIELTLDLIHDCVDDDVSFEPLDPVAHDPYASDPKDVTLAWNLGHVIVHVTASSEESASLAAELARGVENHGRSRYEVPWQSMSSIAATGQPGPIAACAYIRRSRNLYRASASCLINRPNISSS